MNIHRYVRVYTGYFFAYMLYKTIFYTLSQICDKVDKIIVNNNFLPDEIKDISTTHKYNIGKEIVKIIRTCGGQVGIVIRPEGVIILGKNRFLFAKLIAELVITTPISKALGLIVMKFSAAKKVYKGVKATKVVTESIGALLSVRLIARFDYWALILTDSLP